MSSWAKATARWFKRLVGGEPEPAKPPAGKRSVCTGAQAVLATEVLVSERVCRAAALLETRTRELRVAGPNAFGNWVYESVSDDSRSAVSVAEGRALAGSRAAAFLSEGRLVDCHAVLHAIAARRAPVVAHAVVCADTASAATVGSEGHGPYHALADTGGMLALARNAQAAVDMALVARRAAELSLSLAVVAQEGPELAWAPESVVLPDADLVRRLLGAPDETIESPTPAQSLLLGAKRRRVPRWFDPDRPAAHGMQLSGQDLAVALAGNEPFFARPVEKALRQSIDELAKLTGRRLELVSRHRLDGAKYAFVAQGAAIDVACAVADYLAREHEEKVGVLGIEWLRPLAIDEIQEALQGVQSVTVLERTADGFGGAGPLMAEIQRALGDRGPQLLSASYGLGGQPLSNADVLGAFENMKTGSDARSRLVLGVALPAAHSDYPKREVLDQKLRGAYPELAESLLAIDTPLDLRPKGARTIALWARRAESPEEVLDQIAQMAAQHLGPHVRSHTATAEQGTWTAEVTACSEPLPAPAGVVWHDVAIVAAPELPFDINPLESVIKEGFALLSSPLPSDVLWRDLPATWRKAIRERDLAVYVLNAPAAELAEHLPWLLGRSEETTTVHGRPERLDWKSLSAPERAADDAAPPLAVRRFGKSGSTYDNVPRFWGELARPRIEQGKAESSPDPYLSLAAVPPSTSGLFQVAVHQNRLPRIDAARCVGCGACWSACPDSAIAPGLIRTEKLLDAAADIAREPGAERNPIADKLKRAHKQLAARVDGTLAKQKATSLGEELMTESFGWLVEQMKISEADQPAFAKAFAATLRPILKLSIAVTEPMFHAAHSREKGSGELLTLAVNPAACQGCGGCSAVCAEEAITVGGRTEAAVRAAADGWRTWEQLPDPSGESISRLSLQTSVGKLPAILTSRHTLLAITGGGGHEPGSGSRLGARLVAGVVEYQEQRKVVTELGRLDKLADRLHEAVRQTLAVSIPSTDLEALDRALEDVPDRAANVGALVSKLDALGERATVDGVRARRLVKMTKDVQALREALVSGQSGMGRARFGMVVASPTLATWAAEFPRNPFAAPVVVDLGPSALDLALGLAEALEDRHLQEVKALRLAELLLAAPTDLVLKEAEIDRLTASALSEGERASRPPLLVLAGPEVLTAEAQPGLNRVLSSRLPIKVVVLDGRERLFSVGEALLPVMVQRRGFVLSSTLAHREHLFDGVSAALAFQGPALVHVYAPSPARHGFDTAITVERAQAAVDCRLHPLLVWDPGAPGVFGTRLSLEGNPDPGQPWAKNPAGETLTPAHFALGEARFADRFAPAEGSTQPVAEWSLGSPEARRGARPSVTVGEDSRVLDAELADAVVERLDTWRTLQELAGIVSPFADRTKQAASEELAREHEQARAALAREYEAKLEALRRSQLEEATERLGNRLLELAGYRPGQSGERPT